MPTEALLHTGWRSLHPDVSLDFQLNRWAAYGGDAWLEYVRPKLPLLTGYPAWRDVFVELGETAEREGRLLHAALDFRSAEFFMTPADPRKEPLRKRLLTLFAKACGISPERRQEVPCGSARLPVYRFTPAAPRETVVLFGGFDSYIEEFFPVLLAMQDRGFDVVAFEGPGQGAVLEDQRVPMTPDWHLPVAAVLDALKLSNVTLVGISLGGCLAIRAAAYEPRVRRVVAFDVLSNFLECLLNQLPAGRRHLVSAALQAHAGPLIDRAAQRLMRSQPVVEWGMGQAMRVFGCARPSLALAAAARFETASVSARVQQDVLLMAGANDHYVPLHQLWDQAATLTQARSITTRVFTRAEQAQAHCQVGNFALAVRVIEHWLQTLA